MDRNILRRAWSTVERHHTLAVWINIALCPSTGTQHKMTRIPTHTTMLVASIGWKRRYVKQNDNACLEIKTETLCRCYIWKRWILLITWEKGSWELAKVPICNQIAFITLQLDQGILVTSSVLKKLLSFAPGNKKRRILWCRVKSNQILESHC